MFSIQHLIWAVISVAVIVGLLYMFKKYHWTLKQVLTLACVVSVTSELIKIFSSMEMVASADGTKMFPYIKMQHLPLHLCSLQILFIFFARFAKAGKARDEVLAFMYPTCGLGAFFALLLPSIFTGTVPSVPLEKAFVYPLAYQFFLFHSMLIVLSVYIPMSGEVRITGKHYGTTLGILGVLAVVSLYLNSMFAYPVYEAGVLQSVEYIPNFFFTYETPIGIALTEKWHWGLYLAILAVLAVALIALFYIPFFRKAKQEENIE